MTPKFEYVYVKTLVSFCQIVIFCASLESEDFEVEGWGKNVPRNLSLYLGDLNVEIVPSNICQRETTLLVAVHSAPSNIKARQAVRETWGSQKRVLGENVEIVFLIGKTLNSFIQALILVKENVEWQDYRVIKSKENTKYSRIRSLEYVVCDTVAKYVLIRVLCETDKVELNEGATLWIREAVLSESLNYDDVVRLDFTESYNNLTLKSVQMLQVAVRKCSATTNFLLKIDDDMFLNLPRLMKLLLRRNSSEDILLGKMMCGKSPIKDTLSKWYCPKYIYDNKFFPTYLSGGAYLMSMVAANKLYTAALDSPLIHIEDVFITGLSAESAGIVPENNNEFTTAPKDDDYCKFQNLITIHYFSPRRMRETFNHFNKTDHLDCSNYEPMFEASKWLTETVFMPSSRSRRLRRCS